MVHSFYSKFLLGILCTYVFGSSDSVIARPIIVYKQLLQQPKKHIIHGKVIDPTGAPLAGALVEVMGKRTGAYTDAEGTFTLDIASGEMLSVSFLGMKRKKVVVGEQSILTITLQEDNKVLNEVVVKAKTNINALDIRARSGIVDVVDIKLLNEKPSIDLGLALQGSVPGLMVTNMGELGKNPTLRIRGNASLRRGNATNEPLYVLDGKIISAETFYNLNPIDIKDIKVLKDAVACALYGIKAANGVIEIASKRGSNDGLSLTYSFNMGITSRGRRGMRLMDSKEKLELERLMRNPIAPGYRYSADYYNKYEKHNPLKEQLIKEGEQFLDSLRMINTDWFDELVHNSTYTKHNLSLRGGNTDNSYYISFDYAHQGGRIKGNDKSRYGVRLNLDKTIGKIGYTMFSVNCDYSKTNTPVGSDYDPTQLVYDLNPYEQKTKGKLYSFPDRTFNDLLHQYERNNTCKTGGASFNLTLEPLKGLNIDWVGGIDYLISETEDFTPGTAYSEAKKGVPKTQRGIYRKTKNTTTNISSNLRVTYAHTFADVHDFTIGANMDYYKTIYDDIGITGYGVGNIKSAAAINHYIKGSRRERVSGFKDISAQLGMGIVMGYTYNGLYDAYASYKRDASSILPSDKRWNDAWAVGAGWTPTNYAFLKDNKVLTSLNLKTSYGVIANLNGVSTSTTVATFAYANESYEEQRQLFLMGLVNKELKAEKTKSFDLSLSAQFFKRFTFGVNLYNRRTEQALLDVPIPTSNGFNILKRNIGVLENNGIEANSSITIIETNNCHFDISGNIAYNKNKVISLYYTNAIYTDDKSVVPDYEVGKAYDVIYGAKSLGINPLTGYPVFSTPAGEKQASEVLNREDVVALGHSTPPYSGSLGLNISYKSLELNMSFYYVLGGINRFNYSYVRDKDKITKNAVAGQASKMWFNPGDEDKVYHTPYYSSSTAEDNLVLYPNSNTVGKSDYFRLSVLSLRYRFPHVWLKKYVPVVKYATIALQGSNLFNWTYYKESDPESGTLAGTLQPIYSLNINLTF